MKSGCLYTGPSRYAVMVLRALLAKPMRIPEIMHATRLHQRTVQAQITALLASDCVRVVRRVQMRPFAGPWAVYGARVEEV